MGIEEFVKRAKRTLGTTDEAINRKLSPKHKLFQLVIGYICELVKRDNNCPIHISEISKAWGIAKSTTIYHLDFLEAQGLIKRDMEYTGFVHYHAVLTDKGRPKILKYEKRIKEALGV